MLTQAAANNFEMSPEVDQLFISPIVLLQYYVIEYFSTAVVWHIRATEIESIGSDNRCDLKEILKYSNAIFQCL